MAREGLRLESLAERAFRGMVTRNVIGWYRRNPHFSPGDMRGKDFEFGRGAVSRDLGLTVSWRSCLNANVNHPRVPTYWFPPGKNDHEVLERIERIALALLSDTRYGPVSGGDNGASA